eukprot:Pgem_evm1s16990
MKKCQGGCGSVPIFCSERKAIALFCSKCKLDDMVNVTCKKCKRDGCGSYPSYNYEGEHNALYCCNCKLDGMINVVSKKCKKGCGLHPSFNFPPNKSPLYCSNCKLEGMVNVTAKCHLSASPNYRERAIGISDTIQSPLPTMRPSQLFPFSFLQNQNQLPLAQEQEQKGREQEHERNVIQEWQELNEENQNKENKNVEQNQQQQSLQEQGQGQEQEQAQTQEQKEKQNPNQKQKKVQKKDELPTTISQLNEFTISRSNIVTQKRERYPNQHYQPTPPPPPPPPPLPPPQQQQPPTKKQRTRPASPMQITEPVQQAIHSTSKPLQSQKQKNFSPPTPLVQKKATTISQLNGFTISRSNIVTQKRERFPNLHHQPPPPPPPTPPPPPPPTKKQRTHPASPMQITQSVQQAIHSTSKPIQSQKQKNFSPPTPLVQKKDKLPTTISQLNEFTISRSNIVTQKRERFPNQLHQPPLPPAPIPPQQSPPTKKQRTHPASPMQITQLMQQAIHSASKPIQSQKQKKINPTTPLEQNEELPKANTIKDDITRNNILKEKRKRVARQLSQPPVPHSKTTQLTKQTKPIHDSQSQLQVQSKSKSKSQSQSQSQPSGPKQLLRPILVCKQAVPTNNKPVVKSKKRKIDDEVGKTIQSSNKSAGDPKEKENI